MLITVVSGPLKFFNTRSLLFPLVKHHRELAEAGFRFHVVSEIPQDIRECELLILDSKGFRELWNDQTQTALDKITSLSRRANSTIWFNTGDSSTGIQRQVIDVVDRYYKNQLLRDRSAYKKRFYGGRVYTHYYSKKNMVSDSSVLWSEGLSDTQIKKLRVSWNLGMNPCLSYFTSQLGKTLFHPRMLRLLKHPRYRSYKNRPNDVNQLVSARMTVNYPRETVSFQRKYIAERLQKRGVSLSKVSSKAYYKELECSHFAVSPFGWGEVCVRDFEAAVNACVLMKPSMEHLETWPNIYLPNQTYLPFPWDLSYFDDWLDDILCRKGEVERVGYEGWNCYRRYIGNEGAGLFVAKFKEIVEDLAR